MHENSRVTEGSSDSLLAYARLVRVPNLFTAPPDVALGAAIAAGAGGAVGASTVVGLAVASILLYAAGTTLNDYFDAAEDARLRPERPIPTGDVARSSAFVLGVTLLVSGVGVALFSGGTSSGLVAAVLALAIFLYDAVFKDSAIGFLVMGSSRGLNVLLGSTAAGSVGTLPPWGIAVSAIIAVYIAGVTFMAESETGESSSTAIATAIVGALVAALAVIGLLVVRSPPLFEVGMSVAFLAVFVVWTGRALRTAYLDPAPETVGPAIGTCILALVVLNAGFTAGISVIWALVAVSFLVPAVGFSRVFDVT
ncbi:UbiA family prenyltransferase (plasmid) [Haloferacaceae archaeon DSL9]